MSTPVSHTGAIETATAWIAAYGASASRSAPRSASAAVDRMHVDPTRAVRPAARLVETPSQLRDEVMADRGVTRRDLVQLSPQARLEAEISIQSETRARARETRVRSEGVFVDLRV